MVLPVKVLIFQSELIIFRQLRLFFRVTRKCATVLSAAAPPYAAKSWRIWAGLPQIWPQDVPSLPRSHADLRHV